MIKRKPVTFNTEKDKDILNYIKNLNESFASYVRRLIREDMEGKNDINALARAIIQTVTTNNANSVNDTTTNTVKTNKAINKKDIPYLDKLLEE